MSYDSSDDQPLAKRFKKELLEDNIPLSRLKPNPPSDRDSFCSSDYCVDDSDFDPNYDGQCIKDNCVSEVFDFCIYCENMFCSIHLEDHKPCCNKKQKKRNVKQQKICKKNEKKKAIDIDTQTLQKDIDTQTLQERIMLNVKLLDATRRYSPLVTDALYCYAGTILNTMKTV